LILIGLFIGVILKCTVYKMNFQYKSLSTEETRIGTHQTWPVEDSSSIDIRELRFGDKIAKGSFGEVYKGYWQGALVAIKRTKLPLQMSPEETQQFMEDFHREAGIMKSLRHPNILQFLGICTIGDIEICIISEFMVNGSLFHILHDKNREIDWDMKIGFATDTCRGMNYLHKLTPVIIHRDLKSHNLLVNDNFKVKVSDFGLAKLADSHQPSGAMTSCGTPSWTAPEVLRNEAYTEKADVYSFGLVLWELVVREEPYPGLAPFQVVFSVGTQGLRPKIPESCPPQFSELMSQCWAENPAERHSFEEILKKLEHI